ncbi:protein of unknown function [[Clostridium] ultunense Esp]|uniref:Uncharacterized protein n=1 Tax=[Clostridium] ultunense Esp TaxID=1288971 RepID=A0A1M4PMI8_9FIRM|nr:protein of unknown function [[Clostridium] ultunense Esp]
MKYYDIGSISEFLSKIKGSNPDNNNVKLVLRGNIETVDIRNSLIKYMVGYLIDEVDKILDIIKVYELDLLAKFLDNYLLKLEIEEFQDEILNYIYLTYDTPLNNSHKYLWDKVSEDAKDRYNIWYANKKLIEFFQGDERYEFWFRYIKDLDAKLLGVNDRQLFLDFDKFVVIEFRYIGNAAYIYSKPYYLINYDGKVSNNRMEDDGYYKNQGSALSRIIHRENWQYRTTKLIWELKNHAL